MRVVNFPLKRWTKQDSCLKLFATVAQNSAFTVATWVTVHATARHLDFGSKKRVQSPKTLFGLWLTRKRVLFARGISRKIKDATTWLVPSVSTNFVGSAWETGQNMDQPLEETIYATCMILKLPKAQHFRMKKRNAQTPLPNWQDMFITTNAIWTTRSLLASLSRFCRRFKPRLRFSTNLCFIRRKSSNF